MRVIFKCSNLISVLTLLVCSYEYDVFLKNLQQYKSISELPITGLVQLEFISKNLSK